MDQLKRTSSEGGAPGTTLLKPRPRASTDILGLIVDREPGLSKSNRKIAHAILSEPRAFVEKPVEELVDWVGVSAPTITRFARSFGCEGLRDLKLKLMGSVRVGIRYLEPSTPPDALDEVVERVVKRAQRTIADAQIGFDLPRAEEAINAISTCRTLYAFGSGGVSSWLVEEIQNRFFRLGIRVVPSSDHQMQMMLATMAERGDVVLCCSLSGINQPLLRSIAIAREYGAKTIALAPSQTPVAAAVDLLVPVDAREDGDVLGPTCKRYGFMIAIDVLAYGAAIHRRAPAREKLRRIKQQFAALRDTDGTQPLCD
jgi:DNA-binding MurR/RpiR family transcriptional regulator